MRIFTTIFLLITLAAFTASSSAEKPRILIIGDSISIGYTPFVREALAGEA